MLKDLLGKNICVSVTNHTEQHELQEELHKLGKKWRGSESFLQYYPAFNPGETIYYYLDEYSVGRLIPPKKYRIIPYKNLNPIKRLLEELY